MKEVFNFLFDKWHKAVTGFFLVAIAFICLPFHISRNFKLFLVFVVIAIGAALLAKYDKTPSKWFNPTKGVKLLGAVLVCILVFGFILPKTGAALWSGLKNADNTLLASPGIISDVVTGNKVATMAPPPAPTGSHAEITFPRMVPASENVQYEPRQCDEIRIITLKMREPVTVEMQECVSIIMKLQSRQFGNTDYDFWVEGAEGHTFGYALYRGEKFYRRVDGLSPDSEPSHQALGGTDRIAFYGVGRVTFELLPNS